MTALQHHLRRRALPAHDVVAQPAGASGAHETRPARASRNPVDCRVPAAGITTTGFILLASIVGMSICGTWIAFVWRAM